MTPHDYIIKCICIGTVFYSAACQLILDGFVNVKSGGQPHIMDLVCEAAAAVVARCSTVCSKYTKAYFSI